MWICLDCNKLFAYPKHYTDTHGLDDPPYECYSGCPYCGGAYAETYECDCCGEWITGEYIKAEDGKRYCENCYTTMELGDED